MIHLDFIDHKILALLTQNARLSITQISEWVNLSATPVMRRIKHLEDRGVISGYHAHTSPAALGYGLSAFVAVGIEGHTAEHFTQFEQQILQLDEVVSCSLVIGRSEDYLIKVLVRDMNHYEEFLLNKLSKISGVRQLHTSFEMREVFCRSII